MDTTTTEETPLQPRISFRTCSSAVSVSNNSIPLPKYFLVSIPSAKGVWKGSLTLIENCDVQNAGSFFLKASPSTTCPVIFS